MIFVTVGVQLPFDRLVRAVDEWASRAGRSDVVAQIGRTAYVPKSLEFFATLQEAEVRRYVDQADLIVAHAGMGSIITALEMGKRIIVLPRRADLGEHRNDHQLATARKMAQHEMITVASNENELMSLLDEVKPATTATPLSQHASSELLHAISEEFRKVPVRLPWYKRLWRT